MLSLSLFCCLSISDARAENNITISPYIIDETTKPRDILKYKIKFSNPNNYKVDIFPLVNDLDPNGGRVTYNDAYEIPEKNSVMRWVRIKRGFEIMPQSEHEEELEIHVSPDADPGKRFGQIIFAQGKNESEGESSYLSGSQPKLQLNLLISDMSVEKAQIISFIPEKQFFIKPPVNFILQLANSGNTNLVPKGQIRIYDRRGREVDTIEVNKKDNQIEPEKTLGLKVEWQKPLAMGKYKAKLELEYGSKYKRDLSDAVFFWVIPWRTMLVFLGLMCVLAILLIILLYKMTYRAEAPQSVPVKMKRKV